MGFEIIKLEDLVYMNNPRAVLEEVDRIVRSMFPSFHFDKFHNVFEDVLSLFGGTFPGYRKCNLNYHDLKHTTDCLLAHTRLIHGASVRGIRINEQDVSLGLIASLLHDTGYIQDREDTTGTGAKHTLRHIERSIRFARIYFASQGYRSEDFQRCHNYLECTGLDACIEEIPFGTPEHGLLGKMLGAADLLGQMANRTYLEKLPFLFHEFKEGDVPGFENERDLILKTPDFWEFTKKRLAEELGGVDEYMKDHFRVRWGVDRDLYRESIENNISYLKQILRDHFYDYRKQLRRGGLRDVLNKMEDSAQVHTKLDE